MPSSAAVSRCARRIGVLCGTVDDARDLRVQVMAELRSVMEVGAFAFVLTDPRTAVGVAPVADVPWMGELPRQIALKYLTSVNRWTTLDRAPVALLHETTGGDPGRSLVWRELLCRHGVSDVASAVFADRFGCWAFLELWRAGGDARFTHAEAELLAGVVTPLTSALRRCQGRALTSALRRCQGRALTLRGPSPVSPAAPLVLLLTDRLEVVGQTPETAACLRLLVPPAEGRAPIPAAAYNVAAQLLANEAGVDDGPPTARVHVGGNLWMTARAARLQAATGEEPPAIAVTLEPTSATDRLDLVARAFALTPRERDLLERLPGRSTRELAEAMVLSEHTVQDHLKAIFDKTGTRSRRSLLALGG